MVEAMEAVVVVTAPVVEATRPVKAHPEATRQHPKEHPEQVEADSSRSSEEATQVAEAVPPKSLDA